MFHGYTITKTTRINPAVHQHTGVPPGGYASVAGETDLVQKLEAFVRSNPAHAFFPKGEKKDFLLELARKHIAVNGGNVRLATLR